MLRVSLIMTCYNCIDHFRESIENALQQDYPDIEYIVVDGGSSDGTAELIQEYAARIRAMAASDEMTNETGSMLHRSMRWVSEPDHGIYDGMNKGIRMASGDVIAVFNDLFTRTDAISLLVAAMERDGADGVHADLIYAEGSVCKRLWQMGDGGIRVADDERVSYPQIHTGWMPAHPTLYLRRAVYERFGEYTLRLSVSADFEFMLRILAGRDAIRLAYVPEVLISMYYGGASNGGLRGYAENIRQAYIALWRNHVTFPLTAIVCRTLRTITQYRNASQYVES